MIKKLFLACLLFAGLSGCAVVPVATVPYVVHRPVYANPYYYRPPVYYHYQYRYYR